MAKLVNSNWKANLRARDLKEIHIDDLETELHDIAVHAIGQTELAESEAFLQENYGKMSLAAWVKNKFGFEITDEDIRESSNEVLVELIHQQAMEMYTHKEAEYPVMASIYHFTEGSDGRLDREALVKWAAERFDADIELDSFRSMQRDEIREMLLDVSLASQKRSNNHRNWVAEQISKHYDEQSEIAVSIVLPMKVKLPPFHCGYGIKSNLKSMLNNLASSIASSYCEQCLPPSKISTIRKCDEWNGRCCCKSSIWLGKITY